MMLEAWGTLTAGRRVLTPLLLVCLCAVSALLEPAAAGAKQRDGATEAKALRALDTYMTNQVAEAPAWATNAGTLITSITSGCPNVLAPLNFLPASQVDQGAVTAMGEESGADLALATNAADAANFERLARALGHLRWSRRSTRSAVARFVNTSRSYLGLAQSDLCGDARALAADNAMTTPPGTLIWLASYSGAKAANDQGISRFLDAVTRVRTPAVLPLLIRGDQLATKVDNEQKAFVNSELPKLLTAFGLAGA